MEIYATATPDSNELVLDTSTCNKGQFCHSITNGFTLCYKKRYITSSVLKRFITRYF